MDEASEAAVVSLHLQDIQALLDGERKDDEGGISDHCIALKDQQKQLRERLRFLEDGRMARSFAAAVEHDSHILANISTQEQIVSDDRTPALRLAGIPRRQGSPGLQLGARPSDAELASIAKYNDTDSMLLPTAATSLIKAQGVEKNRGDKRRREIHEDEENESPSKRSKGEAKTTTIVSVSKRRRSLNHDSEVAASSISTATELSTKTAQEEVNSCIPPNKRMKVLSVGQATAEQLVSCVSCGETDMVGYLSLKTCEHRYCNDCITSWVKAALEPNAPFPPICCKSDATLEVLQNHLSPDLIKDFRRKEQAKTAAACPLLCAEPGCLVGIRSEDVVDDKGHCPACKRYTCKRCRMRWHEDLECAVDEEQELVMEMAKKEGWQSCYHCGNLVELDFGCYHMMCV